MRENIVALVQAEAQSYGEDALEAGADRMEVARVVMAKAKKNWLAPEDEEAFAGAVAALWHLYPDDEDLRAETAAIGDRNKMLSAVMSGVPVDFDAWEPTPMPENAIGLVEIWREA